MKLPKMPSLELQVKPKDYMPYMKKALKDLFFLTLYFYLLRSLFDVSEYFTKLNNLFTEFDKGLSFPAVVIFLTSYYLGLGLRLIAPEENSLSSVSYLKNKILNVSDWVIKFSADSVLTLFAIHLSGRIEISLEIGIGFLLILSGVSLQVVSIKLEVMRLRYVLAAFMLIAAAVIPAIFGSIDKG